MATVFPAITTLKTLEIVGFNSQVLPTYHGFEAAGQTYSKGDVLIVSTGRLAIGTAAVAATLIAGIAQKDATGTTDADVPFTPFLQDMLIEAVLDDDGTTGHVAVIGDIYNPLGLGLDTGVFFLDENNDYADDPTDAFAQPVAFARQKDSNGVERQCAVGDTRARVYARIMNSAFVHKVL